MRTIEQMVRQEMRCCVSGIVSALAHGEAMHGHSAEVNALPELVEKAAALFAPVEDYEEAARQAGWSIGPAGKPVRLCTVEEFDTGNSVDGCHFLPESYGSTLADAARYDDLEPYGWEVYEHWAVSLWLAEQLGAAGESVDMDFAGLHVWARTSTGQSIETDAVIQTIYRATHPLDIVTIFYGGGRYEMARWDDVKRGAVQGIPADAADRVANDIMHRGVSRIGPVIEVCTDLLARARA